MFFSPVTVNCATTNPISTVTTLPLPGIYITTTVGATDTFDIGQYPSPEH